MLPDDVTMMNADVDKKNFQLDEQMVAFQSVTELTNLSSRIRFLACQQIELCLRGIFAKSEVLPFGSSVNSFGKRDSDLDMIVVFDGGNCQVWTFLKSSFSEPVSV